MEIAMTDYKEKYFDEKFRSIDSNFKQVFRELKGNTDLTKEVKHQAEKTNGRVDELEQRVFKTPKPKDLPSPWKDPAIIRIALMIVLAIVLGLTGIRIAGLSL